MVWIFWAAKKRHFWFQLSEFQEFFFLKIEKSPKIDKIIIHELFLKAPVRKPVGDILADILKEIQFNLCTLCKHTVHFGGQVNGSGYCLKMKLIAKRQNQNFRVWFGGNLDVSEKEFSRKSLFVITILFLVTCCPKKQGFTDRTYTMTSSQILFRPI